jgi:hypothetical protein
MQQWRNGTAYLNEMLGECTGFVQFIHRDFMNVMCIVYIGQSKSSWNSPADGERAIR